MKEIKLIVDGKEVQLTEEQVKALGFDVEKNPFERLEYGEEYFYVSIEGKVSALLNENDETDSNLYLSANYCTDKELMTKRAKQEVLNRLLWRFSMENGWDDRLLFKEKWYVVFSMYDNKYKVADAIGFYSVGLVYFTSEEVAQRAIDEIIIPFEKGELEVCKIWEE